MQITTIKVMKRKNLGNYEHEEITLEAMLSEGEDSALAIIGLKDLVHAALNSDDVKLGRMAEDVLSTPKEVKTSAKKSAKPSTAQVGGIKENPEDIKKEEVKSDVNEEGQDIPPPIPEEAKRTTKASNAKQSDTSDESGVQSKAPKASTSVAKNIVAYDTTIKEHRSRFATYLNNNYPKWTPDAKFGKEDSPEKKDYHSQVTAFSKGLHGSPFEDQKGNMLESFKESINGFFGK